MPCTDRCLYVLLAALIFASVLVAVALVDYLDGDWMADFLLR